MTQTLDSKHKLTAKQVKSQLQEISRHLPHEKDTFTHQGHDIDVTATACTYGGYRYWLHCTKCDKRATVLYLDDGAYKCVKCTRLPYASQMQQPIDRARNKLTAIRERLGWVNALDQARPYGMWQSTFNKLVEDHNALVREIHRLEKGKR